MAFFRRSHNPKTYLRYQSYRSLLAHDFNHQCAYCEMTEGYLWTAAAFGIDHFRPFKSFPELECEYTNLYYCCNSCNSYKGSTWPDPAATLAGEGFADPCVEDPYLVHLRVLPEHLLEGLSPTGTFTLRHIRLNREMCRRFRARRAVAKRRIEDLRRALADSTGSEPKLISVVREALDAAASEWDELYSSPTP